MPQRKYNYDEIVDLYVNKKMKVGHIANLYGAQHCSIKCILQRLGVWKPPEKYGREPIDITGLRSGRLKAIKPVRKKGVLLWECKCDCGNIRYLNAYKIRYKLAKCCGCWKRRLFYEEISGSYWCSLKGHAKINKRQFDISKEYCWNLFLKQDRKCALSGRELCFVANYNDHKTEQTASLDRIDSSKDYIEGNVQWIHKELQFMKLDYSQYEFIEWCKAVAEFNNKDIYENSNRECGNKILV